MLAILPLLNQPANPQAKKSFDGFALVDKFGGIRKPTDYRDLYQTLGSYFVLDPKKEVFGTDHAQMTTGDAHRAKDTKVRFVLIKDSQGRYPHNPLFGDGWAGRCLNPMH